MGENAVGTIACLISAPVLVVLSFRIREMAISMVVPLTLIGTQLHHLKLHFGLKATQSIVVGAGNSGLIKAAHI